MTDFEVLNGVSRKEISEILLAARVELNKCPPKKSIELIILRIDEMMTHLNKVDNLE